MNAAIQTTSRLVRRYADWRGWFVGMYLNAVRSATGVVLAVVGTNSAQVVAPDSMKDFAANLGINWKQAVAAFVSVLVIECIRYINGKPLPDAIERPITAPPFPAAIPPNSHE